MAMKTKIIFICFFLATSCQKIDDKTVSPFSGKIKTILYSDSGYTKKLNLLYNNITNKLDSIKLDTTTTLVFSIPNANSIQLKINYSSEYSVTYFAHLNNYKKVKLITQLVDVSDNTELVKYYFRYNNIGNLDSLYEPDINMYISSITEIKNYDFIWENGNCSSMYKSYVSNPSNFESSFKFAFTEIDNNNYIPWQEPTSYTPFYIPVINAPVSILNLFCLYDNTIFDGNKNLIKTVSINDTNSIHYNYFIKNNNVKYMFMDGRKIVEFEYY